MKRIFSSILSLLVLSVGVALSENPHYKKPPSCSENGLTATCTGSLAGLGPGNDDVLVRLSASGTGTPFCRNPGNGNVIPGKNTVPVNVSGSLFVPASDIKNGNLFFMVPTQPPTDPSPQDAGCPNSSWIASWTDGEIAPLDFRDGTLRVYEIDSILGVTLIISTSVMF